MALRGGERAPVSEPPHDKVDLKTSLDSYRARVGTFRVIDIPERRYLMIDGAGDPNTDPRYTAALGALYPLSYAVKFASKRLLGRDYVVPPLEGLWWAADMTSFTSARDKSRWSWTMMVLTPEWVDAALVAKARNTVMSTTDRPAMIEEVRWEPLAEGTCVQTLHAGSFDDEAAVLERMHEQFIPQHGYRMTGRHHKIYFSDPRRVASDRMRTLLRQPVTR